MSVPFTRAWAGRVRAALGRLAATQVELPQRMPRGAVTLAAEDLVVTKGSTTILDRASVHAIAGEVLMLVGPNGAGKSTLLAALAGDVQPTAGVVLLEGMPVRAQSHSSMARRRAVLPQQHVVGFSFTAEAVVRMGRAPWGRTARADEDDDTVRAAMETCDVAHLGHRPFGALSGGEKARVALARVLAQSTQTLLLDEPTAALDVRHQEEVMRIATDRAAAGDAVVVVMHDLGLASAFGDRVAVMDSGQVRATGTPLEVLREDLLSEVYRYPIEVSTHAGAQLITPRRARRS